MIAYKVVVDLGDTFHTNLVSAFALRSAQVNYKIGVRSYAPEYLADQGYHLFVYRTLADVSQTFYPERLYKVETGKKIKLPLRPTTFPNSFEEKDYLFTSSDFDKYSVRSWPKGTVMVEWVRLLERVNWGNRKRKGL